MSSSDSGQGTSQPSSSHASTSSPNEPTSTTTDSSSKNFDCNICLDAASDAVISMCGHLFCWPCLYQWMKTQPNRSLCPVCKAPISRDKVIPLYGRGNTQQRDPRDTTPTPPRPQGQRTEAPNSGNGFSNIFGAPFGGDGGMRMSFGIGAFPFSLFTASFNVPGFNNDGFTNNNWNDTTTQANSSNPDHQGTATANTVMSDDSQFLSNLFLGIAVICIIWLLLI